MRLGLYWVQVGSITQRNECLAEERKRGEETEVGKSGVLAGKGVH